MTEETSRQYAKKKEWQSPSAENVRVLKIPAMFSFSGSKVWSRGMCSVYKESSSILMVCALFYVSIVLQKLKT
jgi:hypothetical protein